MSIAGWIWMVFINGYMENPKTVQSWMIFWDTPQFWDTSNYYDNYYYDKIYGCVYIYIYMYTCIVCFFVLYKLIVILVFP